MLIRVICFVSIFLKLKGQLSQTLWTPTKVYLPPDLWLWAFCGENCPESHLYACEIRVCDTACATWSPVDAALFKQVLFSIRATKLNRSWGVATKVEAAASPAAIRAYELAHLPCKPRNDEYDSKALAYRACSSHNIRRFPVKIHVIFSNASFIASTFPPLSHHSPHAAFLPVLVI